MLKILKKINNYYVRLPKIIGAPPALQHSWALELPIQMYSVQYNYKNTGIGTFQLLTITGIQILLCCLLKVFGITKIKPVKTRVRMSSIEKLFPFK